MLGKLAVVVTTLFYVAMPDFRLILKHLNRKADVFEKLLNMLGAEKSSRLVLREGSSSRIVRI